MDVQLLKQADLPLTDIAHELVGAEHGARVCVIFVDAAPGDGPSLHRHPYEEIFITLEGEVTFVAGDRELIAAAGDILIVPPRVPHAFTNSGSGRLRQIDIHVSPVFDTEWL